MRSGLLAAIIAAASLSPARGDEPATTPKQGTYVVLVGVGRFDDKAIQPRPTAESDAQAFYDLFTDAQYMGVPADRVSLLTSTPDEKRHGKKATRENIIKAFRDAVSHTGKDDLIILGFFGRGAPAGDKTALFATDSTVKDRSKDAVLGSDLGAEFKSTKNRKVCVFLDVAYKGFDAGKETLAEPTLRDVLSGVFGGGEEKDPEAEQVVHDKVVFLSTVPATEPLTKGDHGLFAADTLDALKGKADTDGYEPDGMVTVDELAKYLEKEVANDARRIGKTAKEKEAVPFIVGEEFSHFPLTKNPAVTPSVQKRLKAFDAVAGKGAFGKDVMEEGKALLTRMPKLKNQQELRRTYQELADGKLTAEQFTAARTKLKDAMRLGAEAAESFARKVRIGIDMLKEKYIKVVNEGDLTVAAIRGVYRRLEEPLPTDLEDEMKAPKELSDTKQKELLKAAREHLGKREDLDDDKDVDMALTMMSASLNDPYTVYYDKDMVKKEESKLRAQFSGVGIHIRRDLARDGLLVVSPIKGSPAYKAGIKAGDLIVEVRRDVDPYGKKITSEADKVVSMRGMKTEDAINIILGKPGVPITLMVEREGEKEPLKFDLERGRVSLETVLGVKRDDKDDWNYWLDEENKIAYVYLSQFGPQTFGDLKRVVEKLNRLGMKGMVLDLRFNPGGVLGGSLMICDLFVESGLLVQVKPRVGKPEKHYDQGFGSFTNFPMAVIINGGSASASEIVSSCLQDHGRAVIVGERSYGKGSVQTIEKVDVTGGEFKMTTARWFPPLDKNVDRASTSGKPEDEWGVMPDKDYEIKFNREEKQELAELLRDKELIQPRDKKDKEGKKPFKDKQLETALDYVKGKIGVKAAKKND
jgi:C-terminal peptidase prc